MGFYTATISTNSSGDGTNLSSTTGNPVWNADFRGLLMGIRLDDNGADAGVDITISEPFGLQRQILAKTDVSADETHNPQQLVQTTAGVDTTFYSPFYVESSNLKVTVAQGGNTVTDAVKVIALIAEL